MSPSTKPPLFNEMKLSVYFDNETEADWFSKLHPLLSSAARFALRDRGENPAFIEELIDYDRPDIILVDEKKAILVLEKTREVPTGHNVGQRMARLVRAVERGVPTVVFFPFDARKHGEYSGICNLNVRILDAFDKMWSIHKTPIVAINWISDAFGELVGDGSEDREIRRLVAEYVDSRFSSVSSGFLAAREMNKSEYARRVSTRKSYETPPPSVELLSTSVFLTKYASLMSSEEASSLRNRNETIVYHIKMTEAKCRREDPYTGMQFIYDYVYCRTGPSAEKKNRNLVLHLPLVRRDFFREKNPNNPSRKSCNWYLTANLLLFNDGAVNLR